MKKTYLIAAGLIGIIIVWMASGVLFPSHKEKLVTIEEAAGSRKEAVRVRTRLIKAEPQYTELVILGRTEARRVVDVVAEIGGKVIATPVEKGQLVKKGDVLCELAEEDRPEQLSRAKAAFEQAQIDYEGAMKLQKEGLVSSAQIAASKSMLESARAAVRVAALNVEHLKTRAPFSGYVEDRPAQVGAVIDRNGVCARLLDEESLYASGQASERDIGLLRLGLPVRVELNGSKTLKGKLAFLGRTADPQTRTYTVEASLDGTRRTVRDGVTARIIIPLGEVKAHLISPAVLALDDNGGVGVRIVNAESRVEFHRITVVKESVDGVWITGLPDEIELITVGQELVADGDRVVADRVADRVGAAK